jgi:dTMP kinase
MSSIKHGKFIVLEGMDGSGKTVATEYLYNKLNELGLETITTREVGGITEAGAAMRKVAFSKFNDSVIHKHTRLLLCLAARIENIANTVYPATAAGKFVVCDRFNDSSYVYQGSIDGSLDLLEAIERLPDISYLCSRPDYLIFLDISAEVSQERLTKRISDNDEYKKSLDKAKIISDTYRKRIRDMGDIHPNKIFWVNAELSLDKVQAQLNEIALAIKQEHDSKL